MTLLTLAKLNSSAIKKCEFKIILFKLFELLKIGFAIYLIILQLRILIFQKL